MKEHDSNNHYDIIVVGGGHSGCEAAYAASKMGAQVLLLTQNIDTIGKMSCNPSIGGIGKSHLVKEISALGGGLMPRAIDKAGIHFRQLNASKGPAVRATRAQADRNHYKSAVRSLLESQANLHFFQQSVEDLILEDQQAIGVVTQSGIRLKAKAVILTTGTFLNGHIHVGQHQYQAGRAGEPAALGLAQRLRALPFRVQRLKTGTPPRLDGRTIRLNGLTEQPSDPSTPSFSFDVPPSPRLPQVSCFITHTQAKTHDIIRQSLHQSPMYGGQIQSRGPRYCPSIEDKIVRFPDKTAHQIFIEPEGLDVQEIYPNGISTSLPYEAQVQLVRSIKGFENAHITRFGYAIEYDFLDPRDLFPWLETRLIKRLFFAGQINGTTGYEEAAAQGLIAGINAVLLIRAQEPWYPKRSEAYIGVLIDDLVTKGTQEPYRMFTSRAEYRLLLREDNADSRLSPIARDLGLIGEEEWQRYQTKQQQIQAQRAHLEKYLIKPGSEAAQQFEHLFRQPLTKVSTAYELLHRPDVDYARLSQITGISIPGIPDHMGHLVSITAKYAGYIENQIQHIKRQEKQEALKIPKEFDYTRLRGLSNEAQEKFQNMRPVTVGQAARIPGITPADITLLLMYLKKDAQAG